ncbi:MAG: Hsp20/alpha crystallin family protein [Chloroflexi bacterium]|nr:Hsp20/alpha crystallin family protein [Chloroflexota bacterium]
MSTLVRWEPIHRPLAQVMDRMFAEAFASPWRLWDGESGTYLPLDVYTTDDAVVLQAAVPGFKPEEVEVTVEGRTVTIRAESKSSDESKDRNYLLKEHRYGAFSRSFDLAIPIQADKAEATFENGMLKLNLPKAEEIKPKVIKLKAK